MRRSICRGLSVTAGVLVGALAIAAHNPSDAADTKELMLKALGTDENIGPIVTEAFEQAAKDLTPEERELALKCWKENVCETGRGELTVALADGFGENVWRQVTHMEFVMQALSYPNVKKIIYTSARGDATKAISDMRSLIAQGANIITMFPDAGEAMLPTAKEATEAGIQVVPYISPPGGEPGKDFLALVAENLCELGNQFVQFVAENASGDQINVVELGGTPGNGLSAAWQKCAEEKIKANTAMTLLGKADTNWTQEGTFEAMSSFLAQNPKIDAVLYEYADGFRGGVRAYEAANRPLDLILSLRTDEQGLFCDWEKASNPNFKIFFSAGGTFQVRIALTAAMAKLRGDEIPAVVDVPFKMKQVQSGMCNTALPVEMPVSSLVDADMLALMFK
ncbi:MAG: substrate-binding domain-containing protein [Alphaproteobacteria bacterium]